MVNILAQLGISRCDTTKSVRIYVGGLPQKPEGALKYQVVYSLEAFHTAGGLSTMAFRYEGVIPTMEYKTLRYPGPRGAHGFLSRARLSRQHSHRRKGQQVSPRDLTIAVLKLRLTKPKSRDLVALRVVAEGTKGGAPVTHTWELIERFDMRHEISAMERTTGFSLAITGLMQSSGAIAPGGVRTPDEAVPGDDYVAELAKRDIQLAYYRRSA